MSNIIQQCVWFYASFLNCIMIERLSNDENGGGWILHMFSYVSSPSYSSINSYFWYPRSSTHSLYWQGECNKSYPLTLTPEMPPGNSITSSFVGDPTYVIFVTSRIVGIFMACCIQPSASEGPFLATLVSIKNPKISNMESSGFSLMVITRIWVVDISNT